jgi:mRNA-degrading endonuclease RelE of RelBE toxin-antitoxin system
VTTDRLRFAESVLASWRALENGDRATARAALSRIEDDPIAGVPLGDPLKGYWSMREEGLRVLYRLAPQTGTVFIVRITAVRETRK